MLHEMPESPQEWEDHLSRLIAQGHHREEIAFLYHIERAILYLPWLLAQRERRVWFAGNGLSFAPLLFAGYGCEVWTTDIAPSAIKMLASHQTPRWIEMFPSLTQHLQKHHLPFPPHAPLLLYPRCEDFCKQAPQDELDLILNFRALQCLSPLQQAQAIAIFFDALREGGRLIVEIQHASPQEWNEIEDHLYKAGFALPFSDAARWYRSALQQQGISTTFFSGLFFAHTPIHPNETLPPPQTFAALREQYHQKQRHAQQQMDAQGNAKYAQLVLC